MQFKNTQRFRNINMLSFIFIYIIICIQRKCNNKNVQYREKLMKFANINPRQSLSVKTNKNEIFNQMKRIIPPELLSEEKIRILEYTATVYQMTGLEFSQYLGTIFYCYVDLLIANTDNIDDLINDYDFKEKISLILRNIFDIYFFPLIKNNYELYKVKYEYVKQNLKKEYINLNDNDIHNCLCESIETFFLIDLNYIDDWYILNDVILEFKDPDILFEAFLIFQDSCIKNEPIKFAENDIRIQKLKDEFIRKKSKKIYWKYIFVIMCVVVFIFLIVLFCCLFKSFFNR